MKKLLLLLVLLSTVGFTYAQDMTKEQKAALKEQQKAEKKEAGRIKDVINQAQGLIESNAKQAASTMQEALTNRFSKDEASTWNVAGKIQQKINEGESQKGYLKQPYDTTLFHQSLYDMYTDYMRCDSLEQIPDAKGKVNLKFRQPNAEVLNQYRQNLIVGGIYFFNHDQNQKAFDFFSRYIDLVDVPMMKSYNLKNDTLSYLVAYYACLAGMKMNNSARVLKYVDMAINDVQNGEDALQYKAISLKNIGDSAAWLAALKTGAEKFPQNQFFYQELISYYDAHGSMSELDAFAEDMTKRNPDNAYFWYVKGYINQNIYQKMDKYADKVPYFEKSVANYKKAVELDPTNTNAWNNLGLCYWEQARAYNDKVATNDYKSAQYQKDKEIIKGFYKQALPVYKKLREMKPDDKSLWLNGLYTCYYNLEMGKELKEIEPLLPKE